MAPPGRRCQNGGLEGWFLREPRDWVVGRQRNQIARGAGLLQGSIRRPGQRRCRSPALRAIGLRGRTVAGGLAPRNRLFGGRCRAWSIDGAGRGGRDYSRARHHMPRPERYRAGCRGMIPARSTVLVVGRQWNQIARGAGLLQGSSRLPGQRRGTRWNCQAGVSFVAGGMVAPPGRRCQNGGLEGWFLREPRDLVVGWQRNQIARGAGLLQGSIRRPGQRRRTRWNC